MYQLLAADPTSVGGLPWLRALRGRPRFAYRGHQPMRLAQYVGFSSVHLQGAGVGGPSIYVGLFGKPGSTDSAAGHREHSSACSRGLAGGVVGGRASVLLLARGGIEPEPTDRLLNCVTVDLINLAKSNAFVTLSHLGS